ncbi:MAG: hypothetical protein ACRDAM_15010 [Casimicrobium sp.]
MDYQKELNQLYARDGLLIPEKVVEFAKDERTALHSHFDWDDTSAAHHWRVEQARNLIRVTVSYSEQVKKDVRVYVSLPSDRLQGGGYRKVSDVVVSDKRDELLSAAKAEMQSFIKRYEEIQTLAGVINAMKSVA